MRIKILSDFRGRETNEQYYQAGQVVDIPDDIAARLIDIGKATPIEAPAPVVIDTSDGVNDAEARAAIEALRARKAKRK